MTKCAKTKRKIDGQYVHHLADLIRSPAWQVLSLPARRLLDRIEIEYLRHGGQDNGKLAVTFNDFVNYGVHRHHVASAARECIALGLLVITRRGRAGNAEFRAPNLFRLPYLEADTSDQKWRQITTIEEAKAVAKRAAGNRSRQRKNKIPVAPFTHFQWHLVPPNPQWHPVPLPSRC